MPIEYNCSCKENLPQLLESRLKEWLVNSQSHYRNYMAVIVEHDVSPLLLKKKEKKKAEDFRDNISTLPECGIKLMY